MINLGYLMTDPLFATPYTVLRRTGEYVEGEWEESELEELQYYGPVQPATEREIEQLPEGDRQGSIMKFFCKPPNKLYISGDNGLSDEIMFAGRKYKIISVKDWERYGYIRAFAKLKDD